MELVVNQTYEYINKRNGVMRYVGELVVNIQKLSFFRNFFSIYV